MSAREDSLLLREMAAAIAAADSACAEDLARAALGVVVARRPADDEALVDAAAKAAVAEWLGTSINFGCMSNDIKFARAIARAALGVYRQHDPLLREMREALEAVDEHAAEMLPYLDRGPGYAAVAWIGRRVRAALLKSDPSSEP